MSTTTINYSVSRIRNSIKAVKEDAFVTDRYIWSVISKYAKMFIKREDSLKKLQRFRSFYKTLPCIELIEVDKIEACCAGVKSGCTIMRTKDKLPTPFEGPVGAMFRSITSMDGSEEVYRTEPGTYTSMTKTTTHKFNKNKYYWYMNEHLYFPNLEWAAVKVEGIWDADITSFVCDAGDEGKTECTLRQDQETNIPEGLFALIEKEVLNEILPQIQIPPDQGDDKNNVFR